MNRNTGTGRGARRSFRADQVQGAAWAPAMHMCVLLQRPDTAPPPMYRLVVHVLMHAQYYCASQWHAFPLGRPPSARLADR